MSKRAYRTNTLITLLGLVFLLSTGGKASADDHIITVTDLDIEQNQVVVFNEPNIGPGFSNSYNVKIDNQSSDSIEINLFSIEEDISNTLTMNDLGMALSYNGQVIASNQAGDPNLTNHKPLCLGPNTNEMLVLRVWMDSSLGNEYQGRSFYANITFKADATKCSDPITHTTHIPDRPRLPNTGESRFVLYFLYVAIAAFALLTVCFLVLFILKRKRRDEKTQSRSK